VFDSTFSHNVSLYSVGGALCVADGAQVTVNNTTFYGNGAFDGGAVYVSEGSLTLTSSTLIDNVDSDTGATDSPTLHLAGGSLHLHGNLIRPSDCYFWDSSAVTSDGGNAVGPGDGCIVSAIGDQVNLDWQDFHLGTFGDYGGPVPTMLPGTLSVAIDPPLSLAGCSTYDTRGEPRDGQCDVGAVERQPDDPESGPLFVDGFESGAISAWQ